MEPIEIWSEKGGNFIIALKQKQNLVKQQKKVRSAVEVSCFLSMHKE